MNLNPKNMLIVDAYSQIFRWFYAMPATFKLEDGFPINAIFGMTKFLLTLEKKFPEGSKVFAFDCGGSKMRLELHEAYKSNRKPMPDELRLQIAPITQFIEAFGYDVLMSEGYEADDVIATLVHRHPETHISIITADKDIAQLTHDPYVKLLIPDRSAPAFTIQDEAAVLKRFGVKASQIPDYLALIGDASDFIPGINGIGPKTATTILKQIESLNDFFENPEKISNPKWRKKLCDERAKIERNLQLVLLHKEVPELEDKIPQLGVRKKIDFDQVATLMIRYQLRSLRPEFVSLATENGHCFSEETLFALTARTVTKKHPKVIETPQAGGSKKEFELFSNPTNELEPNQKYNSKPLTQIEDDLFSNFKF